MSRKLLLPVALAMLTAAFVFAADDAKKTDGHADHHNPDHLMATCIALGNQEEVAISEVAREKTSNKEVEKFAEMMIRDHHQFLEKLQKFAPEATKAGYLNIETKSASTDSKGNVRQTAADDKDKSDAVKTADDKSSDGHHHFNHMAVERELAAECLNDSKEELNGKSGSEFDKCYIGMQMAMHMGMRAKLKVFQRHASGDLASVLAAGQKTTEQHLAKATEIMKDLEHTATTTTTIKDGARKKVIKEKVTE